MSSEKVAENSRFWRRAGSRARTLRMSRMKPMSSIRSASSSTKISTRLRVHRALPHMVEQASGRGDQDVHAPPERLDLRVDVDAAEDDGGGQRQVFAVGPHALLDLGGQFAGGRQDEGAHGDAARAGLAGAASDAARAAG